MRRIKVIFFLAAAVAASAVVIWKAKSPAPLAARPNIILISIDTLSAKHLNTYGYQRHTAPFLEAWAKENFVFENSYAASSYTAPSHMSMFTGLHVGKHKITLFYEGDNQPLDPKIPTLAELMRAAGYDTAWFGILDDDHLDLRRGFERGFDFFSGSDQDTELTPPRLSWLTANTGKPKFVFMHSYLTHSPYLPPREFIGQFEASNRDLPFAELVRFRSEEWRRRNAGEFELPESANRLFLGQFDLDSPADRRRIEALYDEEILYMDQMFRGTIDALKAAGLYENTIVILTSDHGEAFWEHGYMDHSTLHREVLNVPLIVHVPGLPAGRSRVAVQGIDILPTLMQIVGRPAPNVDGKSFWPVLRDRDETVLHKEIFAQTDRTGPYTILDENWKLIEKSGGDIQLYRLVSDPFETANQAAGEPETALKYRRRLSDLLYDAG